MAKKYAHILSPMKLGNHILKSRLTYPQAINHALQGAIGHPADATITYLARSIKNGAAVVNLSPGNNLQSRDRYIRYDLSDLRVLNEISREISAIQFYGGIASVAISPPEFQDLPFTRKPAPPDWMPDPSRPARDNGMLKKRPKGYDGPILDLDGLKESVNKIADLMEKYTFCGAEMASIRVESYLNPLSNLREDEFGGSLENRCRYPIMIAEGLKKMFGGDFLVEFIFHTGIGKRIQKGLSIEDTVAVSKIFEASGVVDLMTLRCMPSEGAYYSSGPNTHLDVIEAARAIKAAGVKVPIAVNGGFQDPDVIEQVLADGDADLVAVGRGFICDYEYGKKIAEGRPEDIVPCVRCNRCHMYNEAGPSIHYCTVNPKSGIQHKLVNILEAPEHVKKVAVIGGGPGGMMAAIECAKRGHQVTLYEKTDYLGGQLRHAEYADFKWSYKRYRDYLVRQLEKSLVNVYKNTAATPGMIREKEYDVVIAALGAKPKIPDIPGVENCDMVSAADVFGKEDKLGKRVVVVGGSLTGVETGLYLARAGHETTVLTRQNQLASDANSIHSIRDSCVEYVLGGYEITSPVWEHTNNFSSVTNATTVKLEPGRVTYKDADGEEHTIETDSIVISGGAAPLMDEALAFQNAADTFYMIGDCRKVENVAMAIRTAYNVSTQI